MWGDTEAVYAGLSPMDTDTCGDETSMHLEGPQSLVNIAHIEKVKRRRIAHSPHNAFRSSGTSPNFLISLCEEFILRLERYTTQHVVAAHE